MANYPIEGLMNSAMNSIKEMIDVNTIIGDPIETSNNIIIIPVSKVNFGFAAGGSEFKVKGMFGKNNKDKDKDNDESEEKIRLPFGGGSGAGVSISPIAFIVVQPSGVKLLPVTHASSLDKLLDLVPDLIEKTTQMLDKKLSKSNKIMQENLIVKLNDDKTKDKKDSKDENENTKENTNNEPSKVTEIESKPYEVEYDETDI